ncbi:MAG: RecB family exonuclease, partial [Actinomycetota bacterium]
MSLPLPSTLSPSKVSSFTNCALAFRFTNIDRLPEPPSLPAVKGTTVHRALELLFDAEPADRTPERARQCLEQALTEMEQDSDYLGLDLSPT